MSKKHPIFKFIKKSGIDITEIERNTNLLDILIANGHKISDSTIDYMIENKQVYHITRLVNSGDIDIRRIPVNMINDCNFFADEDTTIEYFKMCKEQGKEIKFKDFNDYTLKLAKDYFSSETPKSESEETPTLGINEDIDVAFIKENFDNLDFTLGNKFHFSNWEKFELLDDEKYKDKILKSIIYWLFSCNSDSNILYDKLIKKYGIKILEDMQNFCDKDPDLDFYNILGSVSNSWSGDVLKDHIEEFCNYKFTNLKLIERAFDGHTSYHSTGINFESVLYFIKSKGVKKTATFQKTYSDTIRSGLSYLRTRIEEDKKFAMELYAQIHEAYRTEKDFTIAVYDHLTLDDVLIRHENTGELNYEHLVNVSDMREREDEIVNLIINMIDVKTVEKCNYDYEYYNFFDGIVKEENKIKLAQFHIGLMEYWFEI